MCRSLAAAPPSRNRSEKKKSDARFRSSNNNKKKKLLHATRVEFQLLLLIGALLPNRLAAVQPKIGLVLSPV